MSQDPPDPLLAFNAICQKALKQGIPLEHLRRLPSVKRLQIASGRSSCLRPLLYVASCLSVLFGVVLLAQWPVTRVSIMEFYFDLLDLDLDQESCILELSDAVADLARPPVDCSICESVRKVDRVSGISQEKFEELYAYSGRPVVIQDGIKNWTATKTFSFDFFKSVYHEDSPALLNQETNCQFFPYKTTFGTLAQAFNMSSARVQGLHGQDPWYFGWSNCDSSAANILRQHYQRPYFLPKVSESSKTDWIFMGSPGYGAHLHIDNVRNPSWQAQVSGKKRWIFEPPPECYHLCAERIEVIINAGETLVFDSNLWFHSTEVQGGEISICIGSEFD